MAVWQYSFQLISKNQFKNIILDDIIVDLKDVFGEVHEQDNNRLMIGDYESDDCLIYTYSDCIDNISCRLDMRVISQEKINSIKWIVEKYDLKFLIIEEKVLTGEEFIENLNNSSASKFAENPTSIFN